MTRNYQLIFRTEPAMQTSLGFQSESNNDLALDDYRRGPSWRTLVVATVNWVTFDTWFILAWLDCFVNVHKAHSVCQ